MTSIAADSAAAASRAEGRTGFLLALTAFFVWGLGPVYFKLLGEVGALEILAHRIVWTVVLLCALVTAFGQWAELLATLRHPHRLAILGVTTLLVSSNWLVFIWAIQAGHILQGSLAYYINPLINVVLGMVFLRERLTRLQGLAVLIAAAGVLNLVIAEGVVPWVSLFLAATFGAYGLLRRQVQVDALSGLLIETTLLVPLAAGYLIWLGIGGAAAGWGDWRLMLLLALSGFVTGVPLVLFVAAAKRLRYATIGLMQYLAPTMHFALALWVYDEPMSEGMLATFGAIWLALALYSWDATAVLRRVEPTAPALRR